MKFKLTNEKSILHRAGKTSTTLYRIIACKDIFNSRGALIVRNGEKGGWVESAKNLSQSGSCWIYGDAYAMEDSLVADDAIVEDRACIGGVSVIKGFAVIDDGANVKDSTVCGWARVSGVANVKDNSLISGNARVCGFTSVSNSVISDHAVVSEHAVVVDSRVQDNAIVSGQAQVVNSSNIKDSAMVNSNAQVSCSNISTTAYIRDKALVDASNVSGDIEISDHAFISKSKINGYVRVSETTEIRDCTVNINKWSKKFDDMMSAHLCFSELKITDDTIDDFVFISAENLMYPCELSVVAAQNKIILRFSDYLSDLLDLQNNFMSFRYYTDILQFFLTELPIKEKSCFSLEQKLILKYVKKLFESEELISLAPICGKKFFDCFLSSAPKAKVEEIKNKKEELIKQFVNYFFFLFVKLYMVIAVADETLCSHGYKFFTNEATCADFIENCDISIADKEISGLNASVIFNNEVCEMAADFCGITVRSLNKLERDLAKKDKSLQCAVYTY